MIAKAVRLGCRVPDGSVICIVSGDADFCPAVEEIQLDREGLVKVEVYSWQHALSRRMLDLQGVEIHYLNDVMDVIGFREDRWNLSIAAIPVSRLSS
jgi:hypothetical protein